MVLYGPSEGPSDFAYVDKEKSGRYCSFVGTSVGVTSPLEPEKAVGRGDEGREHGEDGGGRHLPLYSGGKEAFYRIHRKMSSSTVLTVFAALVASANGLLWLQWGGTSIGVTSPLEPEKAVGRGDEGREHGDSLIEEWESFQVLRDFHELLTQSIKVYSLPSRIHRKMSSSTVLTVFAALVASANGLLWLQWGGDANARAYE
ncbi:unnamed protein product [Caenorhabditis auriculariae]|uniref:Uncharacterized protein n=1 Tax=Caenorhabditis auriculariae TaxID=2777116 RepID=A0A8S1HIH4_9PELO|nr:unnamed protein product [Caenorhabditis auriculariae]